MYLFIFLTKVILGLACLISYNSASLILGVKLRNTLSNLGTNLTKEAKHSSVMLSILFNSINYKLGVI